VASGAEFTRRTLAEFLANFGGDLNFRHLFL
jgi:hypothetical protein